MRQEEPVKEFMFSMMRVKYCRFRTCVLKIFQQSFKGSVQRKLRWGENGVNRSVGASDCYAGHTFVVLFRFHLGFAILPFLVSTVKIIGKLWINRRSGASDVAAIELALYSSHS